MRSFSIVALLLLSAQAGAQTGTSTGTATGTPGSVSGTGSASGSVSLSVSESASAAPSSFPTAIGGKTYTAVRLSPNAIYEIGVETRYPKKILDTEDVGAVSITNDPVSGNLFVVTGLEETDQILNRLCEGALHPIAPISPSTVSLLCLASGPSGVYAIGLDEDVLSLGKLDATTGEWTNLAPLSAPYDSLVLAQNDKGVIHYVNGDGTTFVNPGSKPQMDVLDGTKFRPGFLNVCGEFDDDGQIVAATRVGGISKYDLQLETIELYPIYDSSDFFFLNDITTGSISDACPSDAPIAPPTSKGKGGKGSKKTSKSKKSGKGSKKGSKGPKSAKKSSSKSGSGKAFMGEGLTGLLNATGFNETLGFYN